MISGEVGGHDVMERSGSEYGGHGYSYGTRSHILNFLSSQDPQVILRPGALCDLFLALQFTDK